MNQLVNRIYELMDELPEAYTVRKNHPDSPVVSAETLLEFLSGWCEGALNTDGSATCSNFNHS